MTDAMTDEMLVGLMSNLDITLLDNSYMEQDLERQRTSFFSALLRHRAGIGNKLPEQDSLRESVREQVRYQKHRTENLLPLSYETGECIRTDMNRRFQAGVKKMKKRAFAVAGFAYGILTMILVAISFIALLGRKNKTV